ncbi:fructosamine kinase family protein [Ekhidna sp. To15]|uniref:fructosamine kinase family protein n=1 Tax=Ekhidna sp. To15 TaxID=3395267 RepID=UPI003F51DBAB
MNDFIRQVLEKHISSSIRLTGATSLAGGCINEAFKILTNQGPFFMKWNKAELNEMFDSESSGLDLLREFSPVYSPQPYGNGVFDNKSYLITEWIEKGAQSLSFWQEFGNNLARQHKVTGSKYGLDHSNYIGSLPQSNIQHTNWNDFFINERLLPQLNFASSKNIISNDIRNRFEMLFSKLQELIPKERPSLLHGDLWSGNFMANKSGDATIFDPAVHYGHRETELAFTQLFGGFSSSFYDHYNEAYPLEANFDKRVDIHNLYPLLVHVNLFGSSYLSGIIQTLNRLT